MKPKSALTLIGLCLTACVLPLLAHHDVAAQYDITKTITIRGVVTKTDWTNPHARVWMEVKNDDGAVSNWEMELPPPNTLKRQGMQLDSIKQGDQAMADIWPAKDGSSLGHALTLTLPGGQTVQFPKGLGWMSKNSK